MKLISLNIPRRDFGVTLRRHETPVDKIRTQLTVIQLAIEVNNPDTSKKAIKRVIALLGPLDALLRLADDREAS